MKNLINIPMRHPFPDGYDEDGRCVTFCWVGQPFTSCDQCGSPAWTHLNNDRGLMNDETRRAIHAKWLPYGKHHDPERDDWPEPLVVGDGSLGLPAESYLWLYPEELDKT